MPRRPSSAAATPSAVGAYAGGEPLQSPSGAGSSRALPSASAFTSPSAAAASAARPRPAVISSAARIAAAIAGGGLASPAPPVSQRALARSPEPEDD
jgi:hypothetical protein